MPAANAGAAGREARTAAWRKSSAEGRSPTRRARCAAAVSAVPAGAPSTAVRCQSGCRRRSRSARRIIVRLLHGIADRVGFLLHGVACSVGFLLDRLARSEEHTSELQSLMRLSYADFCLKTQKINQNNNNH